VWSHPGDQRNDPDSDCAVHGNRDPESHGDDDSCADGYVKTHASSYLDASATTDRNTCAYT
jgi:hypothetical protein